MKVSKLLRLLIDIMYFTLLTGGVALIIILFWGMFFSDGTGIIVQADRPGHLTIIDNNYPLSFGWEDYAKMFIPFMKYVLFFASIHYLRKAAHDLTSEKFFNKNVSASLLKCGYLIAGYALISAFGGFILHLLIEKRFKVSLDFIDYGSFLFLMVLGLFMILLSKVIIKGMLIETENKLTI